MKKRRIASTRHMSKDDKRRLQLNKRPENKEETKKSKHAMFARPDGSKMFVRANGNEAVRAPLNKRLIAVILAIVMVVGLIPTGFFLFRPKADSIYLDPVEAYYRVNGTDYEDTVEIPAGVIENNKDDITVSGLDSSVEYVKTLLVHTEKGVTTESEVYAVGGMDNNTYFSLSSEKNTGTKLDTNTEKLVVVYATKYYVTASGSEDANTGVITTTGGSYTTSAHKDSNGNLYVWGGEDLVIKNITPATDYKVSTVTYITPTKQGPVQVKNSTATVPSSVIDANVSVAVTFAAVTSYSITDVSAAAGVGNGGIAQTQGESPQTSTDSNYIMNSYYKTSWTPDSVAPNGSTEFVLFSASNTGGSEYLLNMIRINDEDISTENLQTLKGTVTKTLKDGTKVTITMVAENAPLYWKVENTKYLVAANRKPDVLYTRSGSGTYTFTADTIKKKRTIYKVEAENVHSNLNIEYNFKQKTSREMIIKGLDGIAETAASKENPELYKLETHYFYYLNKNDTNIYKAYYKQKNNNDSNNLYLYRVEPGYNPYLIEATVSYDYGDVTAVTLEDGTAADTAENVIISAGGKFNTSYRHWGAGRVTSGTTLVNKEASRNSTNLLLTDIYNDEDTNGYTWYAIAVKENSAYNQMLYLQAPTYKYKLKLDLNGGSMTDSDYDSTTENGNTVLIEKASHTVEDATLYANLPETTPTNGEYFFEGWYMLDANGNQITDTLYDSLDQINIDEDTIANAYGTVARSETQYLSFVAVWKTSAQTEKTYVSTNIYKQVPSGSSGSTEIGGKSYTNPVSTKIEQQVKGKTALLNDHTEVLEQNGVDKSEYYEMRGGEDGTTYTVLKSSKNTSSVTDITNLPKENRFAIYYDYKLEDLTIKNTVLGYPKTQNYEITVTLTRDPNSPLTFAEAKNFIAYEAATSVGNVSVSESGETITLVLTMTRDEKYTISDIPYGWTYTVAEDAVANDYTRNISSESGTLKKDLTVEVTNMVDNSSIQTTKTLSAVQEDGNYDLTLEAYATGQSVSKNDGESVPLDIALVIDQSGSMGTEDMSDEENTHWDVVTPANNKWTINEATKEQYYYKVGNSYYPVKALEGDMYEKVDSDPQVLDIFGWGHVHTAVGTARPHFNVPTNYYFPDPNNDGIMRKVFFITTGADFHYCAHPYFYTNPTYTENGETKSYEDMAEWYCKKTIVWTSNYDWTGGPIPFGGPLEKFSSRLSNNSDNAPWPTIVAQNRVMLISKSGTAVEYNANNFGYRAITTSTYGNHYTFTWISDGDTVAGMYQKKDGTNYNQLAYVNDAGEKIPCSKVVYLDDTELKDIDGTSLVLYTPRGTKRVEALQTAVTKFAQAVAEDAAENNLEHRMAIIGFAGNKVPALSSGVTAYNTTKYDYTNTGLFVNSSFQNYQTITGLNSTTSSNRYSNRHYYTTSGLSNGIPTGNPLRYFSGWYQLSNGSWTPYSGSSYYEPSYTGGDLTSTNYQDALVDVSQKTNGSYDGTVATSLTNAINNFGYYGGTYTSYGMTMANKLFENNPIDYTQAENENRQRVIIVFTDGEPGASGYDSAIAGEALVDGNIAKLSEDDGGYNAKVYTVGLFKSQESTDVEDFMNQLSSNYTITTTKADPGDSYGEDSSLNPNETYYYTDTDGKTYALTSTRNGASTLGWWRIDDSGSSNVYTSVYQTSSSSDTGSANRITFYRGKNKSNALYADSNGNATAVAGTTYYDANNNPIRYEYRWYDSNNGIKDPYGTNLSSSGSYSTKNMVQFFSTDDPVENGSGYYLTADSQDTLNAVFETISKQIGDTSTHITLGEKDAFLRDVITENFSVSGKSNVTAYTVDCKTDANRDPVFLANGDPDWDDTTKKKLTGADIKFTENEDGTTTVDVYGFDYSKYYTATKHAGKKLIVEIEDLVPEETGYDLASNTNASGVYAIEDENEEPEMVMPFSIPKVNRPEHKLQVTGDDTTTGYTLQFILTDSDDNPVSGTYTVPIKENGSSNLSETVATFTDGVYTWTTDAKVQEDINSIIFEDFDRNETNGYQISAKAINPSTETKYNYTVSLDDTDEEFGTKYLLSTEETQTTIINSKLKEVTITVNEITEKESTATADYSDPYKEFDILLTLKDESGNKVSGTYSGVTFTDGEATLTMYSGQLQKIALPIGYLLSVDEDSDVQGAYNDYYQQDSGTEVSGSFTLESISANTTITVYNRMPDIVVTGLFDNGIPFSVILLTVFAALGLAASGAYVYRRKKTTN